MEEYLYTKTILSWRFLMFGEGSILELIMHHTYDCKTDIRIDHTTYLNVKCELYEQNKCFHNKFRPVQRPFR